LSKSNFWGTASPLKIGCFGRVTVVPQKIDRNQINQSIRAQMRTSIIGLTGEAHSGKDTSADYLVSSLSQRGYKVIKISLADRLKVVSQKLIQSFYGIMIPLEDFYDEQKKELIREDLPQFNGKPFKLRTVLQTIGTDIIRQMIMTDVWCRYLKEKIIDVDTYDMVVISDIRMPDEIVFFKQLYHFQCYRILRPNRHRIDLHNSQHSTENQVASLLVDGEIDNQGSFDDLYRQLDTLMASTLASTN
jgi:dephospho-CoA kinase